MDDQPWSRSRAWLYSLIFRSPKSNALLVDLAALSSSDCVLDIGCGPGAAVRLAADIVQDGEAVGIDRADSMIEIARKRSTKHGNARFEVGSAESVPFPANTFTMVWSAHSFHHWEDPKVGMAEMHRVLVDGGRALILELANKKHGLTDTEANAVSADLRSIGFHDVATRKVDKQVLISAVCRHLPPGPPS